MPGNSSLEVRGKSRMDHQYWQHSQLIWEFLMGVVCLQSLGGCVFLKGACFPSLLPFCIVSRFYIWLFLWNCCSLLIKGTELGELKCPHLSTLLYSLPWSWSLSTLSTLCAHTISPLLLTGRSMSWVHQTAGQVSDLSVLLQMHQAARESGAGWLLYPGAVLHFWNT